MKLFVKNKTKQKIIDDLLCIVWMEIDRRAKKQLKQNQNQNQTKKEPSHKK